MMLNNIYKVITIIVVITSIIMMPSLYSDCRAKGTTFKCTIDSVIDFYSLMDIAIYNLEF